MLRRGWVLSVAAAAVITFSWSLVGGLGSRESDQADSRPEPDAAALRRHQIAQSQSTATTTPAATRTEVTTGFRGRVVDAAGHAVSAFDVHLVITGTFVDPHDVLRVVAEDGFFRLSAAEVESVRALVVTPVDPNRGTRAGLTAPFEDGDDEPQVIRLGSIPEGAILVRGSVVAEGGDPVCGAQVAVSRTMGGTFGHVDSTVTASDGTFAIHVPAEGSVGEYLEVVACHSEFGLSDAVTWRVAGAATVLTTDGPLRLEAHRVRLVTVDDVGQPIGDVELTWSVQRNLLHGRCRTGVDGAAELRVPRRTIWTSPGRLLGAAGSVEHDVEVQGHDRRFVVTTADRLVLTGVVRDEHGAPCSATVSIWSADGIERMTRFARAGTDGRFELKGFASGYRVLAVAYRSLRGAISPVLEMSSSTDVELRLAPPSPISLQVRTAFAWSGPCGVQVFDEQQRLIRMQQVVPGRNELWSLPPGRYQLCLLGANAASAPLPFEVPLGQPVALEVDAIGCASFDVELVGFDIDLLEQRAATLIFEGEDGRRIQRPARGSSYLPCAGIVAGAGRFLLRDGRGTELGRWNGRITGAPVTLRVGGTTF